MPRRLDERAVDEGLRTPGEASARTVARVRGLARAYEPPDFAHVPDPDAAIFLCAVDHKTGYSEPHALDGAGPYSGSELMWICGLRAAAAEHGLLSAKRLRSATAQEVAAWFQAGNETVADPARRAELWRDLASGLVRDYAGSAQALLDAAGGMLSGSEGLIARLRPYAAFSDPLGKKSFLFAKIAERRGWLEVSDPEAWEVAADNVLMRLALRSGLVAQGSLSEVRSATRAALKEVARKAGISPPILDDMLWELGRENPDLLGRVAKDLREPPRDPDSAWY
jgi:hypothetical protein